MKSALLSVLLCFPTALLAQSGSGAELRTSGMEYARICGPTAQGQASQNAAACNIWLTGVMDGLQAYNSNLKTLPPFDAPNVTVGQVSKLVLKYVADHPDRANLANEALVLGPVVENYPHKEGAAPPK